MRLMTFLLAGILLSAAAGVSSVVGKRRREFTFCFLERLESYGVVLVLRLCCQPPHAHVRVWSAADRASLMSAPILNRIPSLETM
jgi:hypothetical protein